MKPMFNSTVQLTLFFTMVLLFNSCQHEPPKKIPTDISIKKPDVPSVSNSKEAAVIIDKNIRSVFQDSGGNYWFGTNQSGVYRYGNGKLRHFTVADGLSDNQILSIQEDDSGNIWFGTGQFGISKFDGIEFINMTGEVRVTKGAEDDWKSTGHELWFNGGGGVFKYSASVLYYLPFVKADNNTAVKEINPFTLSRFGVYSILKDKKGTMWFGTQAEGVCRYDGRSLTWVKQKNLSGSAVLALFEDSKGNLWFGNNGGGLFRYDGNTIINLTAEHHLNNADFKTTGKQGPGTLARVYAINEDKSGNIWVGTVDAGVWKYNSNTFTNYTERDGLKSNAINTIYNDKNGELWFGTDDSGIFKFNGTHFSEVVIR